jgi:cold shock protein
MELFFQFEDEAVAKAKSLRARGLEVEITAYEGGRALAISGPRELMEALVSELAAERASEEPRVLTGTVRWWKDEKGYGRITGDDGYIYFSHFSALQMDGYKTVREGQRVEFVRVEGMADHGRAGAANVRLLS